VKRLSSWVQYVIVGFSLVAPLAVAGAAQTAESPYTVLENRPIKALSADQVEGYETGQGMGFALAAELNGYPGPKHVLEFGSELGLSEAQLGSTEKAFADMKESAEDLGGQIVTLERELDQLFASHAIDAENLATQVAQIAQLQGQLRTVHLSAHLVMMGILNHDQIRRYIELRGYHGGEHQGHHPDGEHGRHR
jgi:hypothetical protein